MRYPWHEMKNRIQNAIFLSAAVMFGTLPMFYYQFWRLSSSVFSRQPTAERLYYLSLSQSFILFAPALLCSLIGFLYAEQLRLPGFGKFSDIKIWMSYGLGLGIIFTPIRYVLFDRQLLRQIPEVFPRPWNWAIAQMIGSSLAQEVILRFGLLTIGIYILNRLKYHRHPWPAIGFISLFGSIGTYVTFIKFHLTHKLSPSQLIFSLILAFCLQWVYGEVYVRKGFLAAVCIHAGLAVKFLLYAIIIH